MAKSKIGKFLDVMPKISPSLPTAPATGVPHKFNGKTFGHPVWCTFCGHFIYGVLNQGKICSACFCIIHHKCAEEADRLHSCIPVKRKVDDKDVVDAVPQLGARDNAPIGSADKIFSPGQVTDFYKIGTEIGRGGCAAVYHAYSKKDNSHWAVKRLERKSFEEKLLMRELTIMRICDHPNLLSMKEAFNGKETIDLIMEFIQGGELFDIIVARKKFSEADAAKVIKQVLEGVNYMHHLDPPIAHRDLKAENVLVMDPVAMTVKISDFGLSNTLVSGGGLMTSCGTPDYVAPEILMSQPYDVKVDLWSTGVLTYILLAGCPPFWNPNQRALFKQIMEADFKFADKDWKNISDLAKSFVSALLVADPALRLSAEQALEHPWLKHVEMWEKSALSTTKTCANLTTYMKQGGLYDYDHV